jgi:regulator of protease activity HflC (stomatin/prohibitin superfamily)
MIRFALAIASALVALWLVWLDRRRAAKAHAASPTAPVVDDDEDDEDLDDRRRPRRGLGLTRLPLRPLAGFFAVLAVVLLVLSVFRVVPPGNAGVPVTFGSAGEQLKPGLHVVWPVTGITNMSTRTQNYTMAPRGSDAPVQVLGRDGVSATVNASLLYRVNRNDVTDVYTEIGKNYSRTVVTPTTRTCTRGVFAQYDLIDAITTEFNAVEGKIGDCIRGKLEAAGVRVVDYQMREAIASPQLQTSLNAAAGAQAVGAASATSPEYLQLQYVLALRDLVTSRNASTLVLPFSNGQPLLTIPTPSTGG